MSRILLVEDHERLSELVCTALQRAGIAADTFSDAKSALQAIQIQPYELLILDRGLPDGDGLDLLRHLRMNRQNLPCLVLTARNALHDRIDGLESGADDYLIKPFAMDELVARVRALLRRPGQLQLNEPEYGGTRLCLHSASVHYGLQSSLLAPAELQILQTLMQEQGKTVRRQKLEQTAWGLTDAVTPNALDVALHRIRKKLNAIGSPLVINNIRGLGYAISQSQT
ncbi:response regulator transcription factor [Rheinheimera faecalis]|uniref:response regulator transcription factor n=1 Tax=Rheinheimera faecalis TaxID=2901141 RepID=UPI001E3FFA31|nr:response regulator transcription factor [Rheinheimera faecalis]